MADDASKPKPDPKAQPEQDAEPALLARPQPKVDPLAAAKRIADRFPIVMARLAE